MNKSHGISRESKELDHKTNLYKSMLAHLPKSPLLQSFPAACYRTPETDAINNLLLQPTINFNHETTTPSSVSSSIGISCCSTKYSDLKIYY